MWFNTSSFTASVCCLSLCGSATFAVADVINVPDDYPTIQQGIDAAVDGDQVWVADGTYTGEGNRDIDFHGKTIIVRGQSADPNSCIIDCEGSEDDPHRGFIFQSGEGNDSRLEGFTITSGYAEEFGGAVYILNGGPTIRDCVFSPADGGWNRVGYLGSGGAIASVGGSPRILNCLFDGNSAIDRGKGGAIYIEGGAAEIVDCAFIGNLADRRGGGVYCVETTVTLSDCAFTDNNAVTCDGAFGGGLYCIDSRLNLTNCTFDGNFIDATYESSGAALCTIDTVTECVDCSFANNLAHAEMDARGGAVYIDGGSAAFQNCNFTRNSVNGPSGILTGGGALYSKSGDLDLINCSFIENSVLGDDPRGGGVYHAGGAALLINCLLARNQLASPDGEGGGIYSGASTLINCTIVENIAACEGGGAYFSSSGILTNSIVSGNLSNGGELFGDLDNTTVSYSDVRGGWPGEGNIDADPLFVDADNGDYRLLPSSPCIDAGNNNAVLCLMADLDGNERFADDPRTDDTGVGPPPVIDMGAFEFASRPAAVGQDCNLNGLEDTCEIAEGITPDCNRNGFPDDCDIADGFSSDCNGNGVPDDCDRLIDCNGNGVFDACDIADGLSLDCDDNGVPDECDIDCNGNGVPDACDIADGVSDDCNGNGVPDECEPFEDCNGNGVHDFCDIFNGPSDDCNDNWIPDECERGDCNENGIPDECEVDCNRNGAADECDIADGVSDDCNENGIPDECERFPGEFSVSAEFGPVEAGFLGTLIIENGKGPPATGDVRVHLVASADLDLASERIDVEFTDIDFGSAFVRNAQDCPEAADTDEIVINSGLYNLLMNEFGFVWVRLFASEDVDACDGSFINVTLSYDYPGCQQAGDIDGDGVVDGADLILLLGAWGPCDDCNDCPADLDGDCTVGAADLITLLGNWG